MANGPQQGKITADQAAQVIAQEGIDPRHVLIILQIVMNMPQAELGRFVQMLQGGGQGQAAPQEAAPAEEEGELRV